MDLLTFGERLGLQKLYEQWLEDNKLEDNSSTLIVFLYGHNLLNVESIRDFLEGWIICD